MTFVSLDNKKKNSPYATLTTSIESTDLLIPVDLTDYFHVDSTTLILNGIVLGFDDTDPTRPEQITLSTASTETGAGILTASARGVNADGTIGQASSWDEGTKIAVMGMTHTDWYQISDNFEAHSTLITARATKTTAVMSVYVDKAATGAADGTSWTDAFTTIQAAINSLPTVLEHAVTIYVRKGASAYAENITVQQIVGKGSLTIRGEYYWYGQCAAAATPSTTKFNVTATDGTQIAAGDSVLVRDGSTDYVYSTVKATVDKGSDVWEIELNDALPTGNIASGDYYSVAKTEIAASSGITMTLKATSPLNIYGLIISNSSGQSTDIRSCNGVVVIACFMSGTGTTAPNGYGLQVLGSDTDTIVLSSYISTNAASRAVNISSVGYVIFGDGTASGGSVISAGTGGTGISAGFSYAFTYNQIIDAPGGNGLISTRSSFLHIGTCTISPSSRTPATTGITASYNATVSVAATTNNATTPKTPASSTDGAYIS